jgi:histidinol phosphatase-like enzyme (inositol monophosphatase family)
MPEPCPQHLIDAAQELADISARIVRPLFRSPIAVDTKADLTPVTKADREAEAAMRAWIQRAYPDHGLIGEELGGVQADAELVWVLDPIDGTKSFIAGKPIFGTLIALIRQGRPILGVIDQPILLERWVGATGHPTLFNGTPARTRACATLAEATLAVTSPDMFQGADAGAFNRVKAGCRVTTYGADCYAYGLLASGFIDVAIEATLKLHDFAALGPVVEGAGGVITDWSGAPLGLSSDGRVCAAGDARAHARALELLAG